MTCADLFLYQLGTKSSHLKTLNPDNRARTCGIDSWKHPKVEGKEAFKHGQSSLDHGLSACHPCSTSCTSHNHHWILSPGVLSGQLCGILRPVDDGRTLTCTAGVSSPEGQNLTSCIYEHLKTPQLLLHVARVWSLQ